MISSLQQIESFVFTSTVDLLNLYIGQLHNFLSIIPHCNLNISEKSVFFSKTLYFASSPDTQWWIPLKHPNDTSWSGPCGIGWGCCVVIEASSFVQSLTETMYFFFFVCKKVLPLVFFHDEPSPSLSVPPNAVSLALHSTWCCTFSIPKSIFCFIAADCFTEGNHHKQDLQLLCKPSISPLHTHFIFSISFIYPFMGT